MLVKTRKNIFILGAFFLVSFLALPSRVSATIYDPGETLEPDCAPGSLNCGVRAPATTGANSDITSLTGLTTPLSVNQGGLGFNTYTAGDLIFASNTSTLSRLGIGAEGKIVKVVGGVLAWSDDNGAPSSGYTAGSGISILSDVISASGLNVSNFATSTISQWVNDLGYVTGTPWTSLGYVTGTPWTSQGYVTGTPWTGMGYLTSQTSHADVLIDGDFSSQGIMLRGATPGSYSILADNSTNWNTAYGWGNHAIAGYVTGTPWTSLSYVTGTPWTTEGYVTGTPWTSLGYITDGNTGWDNLYGFLSTSTSFGGDVSGNYDSIVVANDSHSHNSTTVSGLFVSNFNTSTVSQWTNDAGYVTGTPWTSLGYVTGTPWTSMGYLTSETSHADVLVDGDFSSQGIMLRGATPGSYSILTDNSTNWNTAYGWGNHAIAGYVTGTPWTSLGYVTGTPWTSLGYITDGNTGWDNLYGFLSTSTSFGGDVSGNYDSIVVANDSHSHGVTTGGIGLSSAPGDDQLLIGNGTGYALSQMPSCDETTQKLIYSTTTNSFICSGDAGAGGGITQINGLTASSQSFATSSDTNIGLSINSTGSSHTFTTSWNGVLSVARGGTGSTTLNDLIALGTNTTGNYIAGATTDSGLTMSGTEGGTLGILLDSTTLSLSSSGLKISDSYASNFLASSSASSFLSTSTSFGGDVSGNYDSIVVANDSHSHNSTTISGLFVSNFATSTISQWVNDLGYVTGTPWTTEGYVTGTPWTSLGYVTGTPWTSMGYLTAETSHADVLVDGDFSSQGIMLRGATPGSYSILTDNSTNWNTAYGWGNHAIAGYVTGTPWTSLGYVTGTPWTTEGYVTGTPWTSLGYVTGTPWTSLGYITDGNTGWDNLYGFLSTSTSFGGDVSGNYDSIVVANDSHSHNSTTISGLFVSNFATSTISQWTNDAGYVTGTPWTSLGYITDGNTNWDNSYGFITDGNTGWDNLYGFLSTSTSFGGDVSGNYDSIVVANDSHSHNSSTISGLFVSNFNTSTVSQWTNDAGYVTGTPWTSMGYLTSETSHADVLVDGDFSSQGIMLRGATPGSYSILTDNSTNWNTAYGWGNHAIAGYVTGTPWTSLGYVTGTPWTTEGYVTGTPWTSLGYITDGNTGWDNLYGFLSTSTSFGGDVSGNYDSIVIGDNSHNHNSTTISGLAVSNFATTSISQWTNNSGYITDGNTNWDNSYGFITGLSYSQIANGAGVYMDYRPNNTACTADQVLKYSTTTSRWLCANDTDTNTTSHSALTGLTNDDHAQYALLLGRAGGQTLIGGTAANNVLTIQGNSATGNTATSSSLQFKVGDSGATTAMTILNSGGIGIGTVAPDKQLEINSTTGNALRLTYNDNNGSAANYADLNISSSGYLSLNPSGTRLGINTTSPLTTLHIHQATGSTSFSLSNSQINTPFVAYSGGNNVFARIGPNSGTAGGSALSGFSSATNVPAFVLQGHMPASPAIAAISIEGFKDDGAGARVALANTETVVRFLNGTTVFATMLGNGNFGLGTVSPTNKLSFVGTSAQTIWMERHSTSNNAGHILTVQSGGATSGATDKNGGSLVLASGISTGMGGSSINFQTANASLISGTSDNAPATRLSVSPSGQLLNTVTNLNPASQFYGQTFVTNYTVSGADVGSSLVNDGLVFTTSANNSGAYNYLGGVRALVGQAVLSGSGNVASMTGVHFRAGLATGSTGNITDLEMIQLGGTGTGTGVITNITGMNIQALSGRGTPTTIKGLSFDQDTNAVGTNKYHIYAGSIAGATNNYFIYSLGGQSYFAGNIGIGTTTPSHALHIRSGSDTDILRLQDSDGSCLANPEAGTVNWSCTSDISLKDDIRDASSTLALLNSIKIRDYRIKASGERVVGVIAQELAEIMPQNVSMGPDNLLVVKEITNWQLIKAIQEQQMQIGTLQSNLSGLSIGGLDELALNKALVIDGEVDFGKDSLGEVVLKAGATSTEVVFSQKYTKQPVVTITKQTAGPLADYFVDQVTSEGFVVNINPVQEKDFKFSWHSFGSNNGIRLFSDGLKENIELVNKEPVAPVSGSSEPAPAPDSSASSTIPETSASETPSETPAETPAETPVETVVPEPTVTETPAPEVVPAPQEAPVVESTPAPVAEASPSGE